MTESIEPSSLPEPGKTPTQVIEDLPEELAAIRSETANFTLEQLRTVASLHSAARRTFDPFKLTLLFESMLRDLGYWSEVRIFEDDTDRPPVPDAVSEEPAGRKIRIELDSLPEVTDGESYGCIDLLPLDPEKSVSDEDRKFLSYLCREVGYVLAHQWLYQKLVTTQERLMSALNTVSEVSAFVGHELRSPVASVVSLSYMLEEQVREMSCQAQLGPQEWKPFMDRIAQVGGLLRKITRSTYLLGTLDITTETLQTNREWVEIGRSLLTSAAEAYSYDISRRKLRVYIWREAAFADDLVLAHRSWFEAIFDNLLGNAVKYSVAGGRIDISIHRDEKNYIIHTSNPADNPPSPDRLTQLFEKGYRWEASFTKGTIGANQGLGLYFVNRIVTLGYGGRIRVWLDQQPNNEEATGDVSMEARVFGDPHAEAPEEEHPYFHIEIKIPRTALEGNV